MCELYISRYTVVVRWSTAKPSQAYQVEIILTTYVFFLNYLLEVRINSINL